MEKMLAALGIRELNDMQKASLEANTPDNDMILLADTGSGKTLGFLLPALNLLDKNIPGTQILIITPSRELAQQIEMVFRKMQTGWKITACYGGHLRETEENNLIEAPTVIVGTAGRLADHLRRENIKPETIHTLILDEFDKSVELGFHEEMAFIIAQLKGLRKRILTSATHSPEIPAFVGLREATTLNFLTGEKPAMLNIRKLISPGPDKLSALFNLICMIGNRSTIIFCNHRESVERTSKYLAENGIINVFYHGAMEQLERDNALCKFRNGTANFLVTTDLASRGLDVPNIRYIIHYHLPDKQETYTHRNGRTARMEASGDVVLILGPEENFPAYIDQDIEAISLPETAVLPEKPSWVTIFIGAGKKDKVNKVDIVGFMAQKGQLKKEDIGLIEVKDFFSFVAIRKNKASTAIALVQKEKIKNKKVKIEIAR